MTTVLSSIAFLDAHDLRFDLSVGTPNDGWAMVALYVNNENVASMKLNIENTTDVQAAQFLLREWLEGVR